MVFLGIIAAGGIFAGTNPSYTPFELAHHIKTSKAKFLITEPEMLDVILTSAKECGSQNLISGFSMCLSNLFQRVFDRGKL